MLTLAASRAMLRRLDQSSCWAKGGLVRAFLSTSNRDPLALCDDAGRLHTHPHEHDHIGMAQACHDRHLHRQTGQVHQSSCVCSEHKVCDPRKLEVWKALGYAY